jgi:hypothetical protein
MQAAKRHLRLCSYGNVFPPLLPQVAAGRISETGEFWQEFFRYEQKTRRPGALKFKGALHPEVFAKEAAKMKRKKRQRLEAMATSLNYQLVPQP